VPSSESIKDRPQTASRRQRRVLSLEQVATASWTRPPLYYLVKEQQTLQIEVPSPAVAIKDSVPDCRRNTNDVE
jgi:hypothetical protein